jgi:hypothetical protein
MKYLMFLISLGLGSPAWSSSFSWDSRVSLPDGSVSYHNPKYVAPARDYRLSGSRTVDTVRVCELLGHSEYIYSEKNQLDEAEMLLWIGKSAMTVRSSNFEIRLITCR